MDDKSAKVAMVTGASRGFGLAVARSLSVLGWSLIIDAREEGTLEEARQELALSATTVAISGDVSSPHHRHDLTAAARQLGGLDLLVNNASVLGPSPQPNLADYDLEELSRVFDVNVFSPMALIQETLPMLRTARGIVVNLTSDAAAEPYPGWGGYGSSKSALDQISVILGVEEPEVSVYALDPGDMNTRMHQEAFPGEDISDRSLPEERVPALIYLIDRRPPSGRYQASDLLART